MVVVNNNSIYVVMTYELFGVLRQMCIVLLFFVDISYSFHKQGWLVHLHKVLDFAEKLIMLTVY